MSRLTGNEVQDLMEAYAEVYYPQNLAEEEIWEDVEYFVNLLLDEGYDLSDYTWDNIYEAYLIEFGIPSRTSSTSPKSSSPSANPRVSNIPAGVKNSPYNLKNLGAAQYSAYKSGGGDAAMAKGTGTVGQIIAAGRRTIGSADSGSRLGLSAYNSGPRAGRTGNVAAKPVPTSRPVSNIPTSTKNSPYNLKNLGASQYSAYKAGGGDTAMAKGTGTVGQIIAAGRKATSRFDSGPRITPNMERERQLYGFGGGKDKQQKTGMTRPQVVPLGQKNINYANGGPRIGRP
jgi:hypothetical protein